MESAMTDISLPARFAETDFRIGDTHAGATSDFRVGRVIDRTAMVLSRNFLPFFLVTVFAQLPSQLASQVWTSATFGTPPSGGQNMGWVGFGLLLLGSALGVLSQGVVLHGAFEDLRGRPVSVRASLQVALRRFFPIIGLSIVTTACEGFAAIAFIVPAIILATMWFVATPACVIEHLGPFGSMGRSSQLTSGHRWKLFGLFLLFLVALMVGSGVLVASLNAMGDTTLKLIGEALWSGAWNVFFAIAAAVTYHDLRVIKEGIDVEQVASVFD
jgi:hypothetical protein